MPYPGPINHVELDSCMQGLDVPSVCESSVHVDKAGSYAMVTAACVYRVTLYASERSVSGNQHLTGSNLSMRWYNQLWYIIEMLVPVRQSVQQILAFTETSRREDFWSGCMTSMSAT
jgi:hypothetical protein